jgi:hypothetical protein
MAGIYYLLQDSTGFDRMMHGKSPKKQEKQRSLEDFIVSMQRVCSLYIGLIVGFYSTRDDGIKEKTSVDILYEWMPTRSFGFWNCSYMIKFRQGCSTRRVASYFCFVSYLYVVYDCEVVCLYVPLSF